MRKARIERRLLGFGVAKIEDVFFEGELLVVRVVLIRRCGPGWAVPAGLPALRPASRAPALAGPDLSTVRTFVEAEVARVSCPEHSCGFRSLLPYHGCTGQPGRSP